MDKFLRKGCAIKELCRKIGDNTPPLSRLTQEDLDELVRQLATLTYNNEQLGKDVQALKKVVDRSFDSLGIKYSPDFADRVLKSDQEMR